MRNLKLIIVLLLVLFSFENVFAEKVLSPHAYLRKLSLHIRGEDPGLDEHGLLDEALKAGTEKKFFSDKISEYLATQGHVEKMNHRLSELFFLESPEVPADMDVGIEKFFFKNNNALVSLFREIAEKNLSWDTLLTGKSYTLSSVNPRPISQQDPFGFFTDFGFYAAVAKLEPSAVGIVGKFQSYDYTDTNYKLTTTQISFDANDPRIAGAITTPRFFERYTNTALNKDRRRSAAIFRIFLCNPLMPIVVPPDDTKTKSLINLARGKAISTGPVQIDKRHGGDTDCKTCHAMLDPMGRTFQTSSLALSDEPAAGALFYKRYSGDVVSVPVKGLGELAKVISTQPEYVECQVRHFWTWFVGADVLLSQERLAQLEAEFNAVQRKPNEFITYLVTQPEFLAKRDPTAPEEKVTFKTVEPTLHQCTACHRQAEAKVADFDRLPFERGDKKMAYWVSEIQKVLDLAHDGAQRTMPPENSQWKPSHKEVMNIKKWIDSGTPEVQESHL